MRFLVDENLSPKVAETLNKAGHDSIHAKDAEVGGAPDSLVMDVAEAQGRAIISADTDFGALLASTRAMNPSVILVREIATHQPDELADTILRHLDLIEDHLKAGAIVAFSSRGIRVRPLPLR